MLTSALNDCGKSTELRIVSVEAKTPN